MNDNLDDLYEFLMLQYREKQRLLRIFGDAVNHFHNKEYDEYNAEVEPAKKEYFEYKKNMIKWTL